MRGRAAQGARAVGIASLGAGLVCAAAVAAAAPVIVDFDFESFPRGPFVSHTVNGITFSPTTPGETLQNASSPPAGLSNNRGIAPNSGPPFTSIRADIAGGTSLVSIDLGDPGGDEDGLFLRAFDASDTFFVSAERIDRGARRILKRGKVKKFWNDVIEEVISDV